jgi:ketosteroid isomerase-like protein
VRYATAFGGKFSNASQRGEDEPTDALGVPPDQRLRDGAARVVADDADVVQVERGQEVGDDPRDAEQRQVGLAVERDRVAAERDVERDAAVAVRESGHHLAPEVAVDRSAVNEDKHRPAAALAVLERPGGDADGAALAEEVADGHAAAILTQMNDPNEDIVREALAAWNRGEWESALAVCHPEIEWRAASAILDLPEVVYGHEGVRGFWRLWTSSWTDIRAEAEEFISLEDGLLVLIRWRAKSKAGIEVDQPVAFQFTIRDSQAVRFVSYWDRAAAFEALGLPARG